MQLRPTSKRLTPLAGLALTLACNDPVVSSTGSDADAGTATTTDPATSTSSSPDTNGASGVVDTSGSSASDSTSSTTSPPATGCVELDWLWADDSGATSFVSGLAFDTDIHILQRHGNDHVVRAFDLDGGSALDPVVIGPQFDGDIDARPTGGVLIAHSSDGVSSLQLRSTDGVLTDTFALSSMGEAIQWSHVLAHTDGSYLMGGMVWVDDHPESALVALDPSGTVVWERRGAYALVEQLDSGPGSSTLALVSPVHNGGHRLIESYGPTGESQWSLDVGSIGPGDSEDTDPSFAFTPDDDGGFITLGTRLTAPPDESDAEAFAVVSRFDRQGALWSTEVPVDDPEDLRLGIGGVMVVGDHIVAVTGRHRPLVVVLSMDGVLRCQQRIDDPGGADLLLSNVVPISPDGFIAGGMTWHASDPASAWVARFEVVATDTSGTR